MYAYILCTRQRIYVGSGIVDGTSALVPVASRSLLADRTVERPVERAGSTEVPTRDCATEAFLAKTPSALRTEHPFAFVQYLGNRNQMDIQL